MRPSSSRGDASAPLSPPRGPPGAHPDAQRPGSNRPRRRGRRRSSGSLPVSTPVRAAKAHSIVDTSSSRAGLWRDRAERELSVVASGAVSEAGERARVAVSGLGAVRANQFHAPLAPKRIRVPTARIYEAAAVGDALGDSLRRRGRPRRQSRRLERLQSAHREGCGGSCARGGGWAAHVWACSTGDARREREQQRLRAESWQNTSETRDVWGCVVSSRPTCPLGEPRRGAGSRDGWCCTPPSQRVEKALLAPPRWWSSASRTR